MCAGGGGNRREHTHLVAGQLHLVAERATIAHLVAKRVSVSRHREVKHRVKQQGTKQNKAKSKKAKKKGGREGR